MSNAPRPLFTTRAVLGEGPDASVPWHYGAPLREQRRLLAGRAVVDLGQFEVLEVSGPDRLTWLTTVTSQSLTALRPGDSTELTVLSPQGRIEHWAQVAVPNDEAVLLIVDHGARDSLRAYLTLMTFAHRIQLRDRDDLRVLGAIRPPLQIVADTAAAGAASLAPVARWRQSWPDVSEGGLAYGPDPEFPEPWFLDLVDAESLEAAARSGALPADVFAGMASAEALRVLNHRPRFAREVDDRSIPHELDLLRTAVHTAKGCYRGQETVAKVMNLGQPPRRLVMLHLDGSQEIPVPVGAAVNFGAKQVGQVTTSALHADEGPVALAVIRRAVPIDAPLTVTFEAGSSPEGADETGSAPTTDAPASLAIDATQVSIVEARDHGARPEVSRLGHRASGPS
ncbi:MAG: folate-binding protein [Dermabacter sp.]|nr:folate-binding protein [Dermabacter sp.]